MIIYLFIYLFIYLIHSSFLILPVYLFMHLLIFIYYIIYLFIRSNFACVFISNPLKAEVLPVSSVFLLFDVIIFTSEKIPHNWYDQKNTKKKKEKRNI